MDNTQQLTDKELFIDNIYNELVSIISKYKEWIEPSKNLYEIDTYRIIKFTDKVTVTFDMTYRYELTFTPIFIEDRYSDYIEVSSNYFQDDICINDISVFLHGLIYALCVVENELPDDID